MTAYKQILITIELKESQEYFENLPSNAPWVSHLWYITLCDYCDYALESHIQALKTLEKTQ